MQGPNRKPSNVCIIQHTHTENNIPFVYQIVKKLKNNKDELCKDYEEHRLTLLRCVPKMHTIFWKNRPGIYFQGSKNVSTFHSLIFTSGNLLKETL